MLERNGFNRLPLLLRPRLYMQKQHKIRNLLLLIALMPTRQQVEKLSPNRKPTGNDWEHVVEISSC
jgi:hypothetical protein